MGHCPVSELPDSDLSAGDHDGTVAGIGGNAPERGLHLVRLAFQHLQETATVGVEQASQPIPPVVAARCLQKRRDVDRAAGWALLM